MSISMDVLVHRKVAGRWRALSPSGVAQHWGEVLQRSRTPYLLEAWKSGLWYVGQNADAYAVLTGILVSAVDCCGEPYSPVAPTRGLPGGVAPHRGGSRRDGSFATMQELEQYAWDRRVRRWGYCSAFDFKRYVAAGGTGEPTSYARVVVSERVRVISAAEARGRLATTGELAPRGTLEELLTYVRVDFEITHAQAAGPVHGAVLPLVRTLEADPADIRLTFRLF